MDVYKRLEPEDFTKYVVGIAVSFRGVMLVHDDVHPTHVILTREEYLRHTHQEGKPMTKSKSARNAHYEHVETIKMVIEVEIGYDKGAREDAVRAATSMCSSGLEIGGGGPRGCYNAVRIGEPKVQS
jgi:hypothetical protein